MWARRFGELHGYEKGVPCTHWGMFQQVYGGDSGTYLLLISHKTLAEIDKGFTEDKQFEAAMGEDGMKKFGDLWLANCYFASCNEF